MSKEATSGGVGLSGLFLVLFVGLKLGKVIDWEWGWVLAPLWIPASIIGLFLLVALALDWYIIRERRRKRSRQ